MKNVCWVTTHQFCEGTLVEATACNKKVQLSKGVSARDSPPTQCKALTSQASYKAILGISKPKFTVKQSQNKKIGHWARLGSVYRPLSPNQQTKTRNEHKSYAQTKKHAAQKKKQNKHAEGIPTPYYCTHSF